MRQPMIRLAILAGMSALFHGNGIAQTQPVMGAWSAERYVLSGGAEHPLAGHIFFDAHEWTVLFFVLADGEPGRGSAEGGTYTLNGTDLIFTHLYNLSVGVGLEGLPESPLQMVARPRGTGPEEPSTIDIRGDVLTIFFPSGNSMVFRRLL